MPTLDDVRALALAMPDTVEKVEGHGGGASWRVHDRMFVWERGPSATDERQLAELGRTWPGGTVVGARTESVEMRDALIGSSPQHFFTIPHFDGYPAVLVRLSAIPQGVLAEVITDAWLARAPVRAAKAWLADHPPR
ncbi:MmcQ/YjbR family DNA-binding protein [Microbacterium sp. P02]|uniref:MmcQ/YjbR family DNA-binding protein n=1 Tax=unclassified Microbacterium TaxID=2609290 RepID=UPI00366A6581